MSLSIIVAVSDNGVIGRDGELPWHISADLKRFKTLTTGHCIIMGRKTFESIGKPLPKRRNIVITRNEDYAASGIEVVHSLDAALVAAADDDQPFVIGGAQVYEEALPRAGLVYLTQVQRQVEGDTFFPDFPTPAWELVEDRPQPPADEIPYSFQIWQRRA